MIIRFLFALLFFVSLLIGSSEDTVRLEKAQKAIQSGDEIEQFRGYNEYKSLYTKALSAKNTQMVKEALEGIVKGGNLLAIDVTKYKSELAKLSPISNVPPATVAVAQSAEVKPSEKSQKPLEFPKEYQKSSPVLAPPTAQLAKEPEALKVSDTVSVLKHHRLLELKTKDTGIELLFDTVIDSKEVKLSKIIESDKQRFRYIIDIDGAAISQTRVMDYNSLQKIRIAQYDLRTLRIVIESTNAIAIKPLYKGTSFYIDLASKNDLKSPPVISLSTVPVQAPVVMQEPPLSILPPPLLNVTPKDRSKKVIVIDPGHGGKDSGAVGNGHMEKDIVLQVGLQLAEELRSMGYTVHMTRSNDTFIELKDRTKFANDKSADLFLSVHANAIPKTSDANAAYGIETYYLSPGRSERAMRVAALENSEDMSEMGAYGKLSFLNVLNSEKIIASNKLAIDIQKGVLNNLRKQYPNVKDNGAREAPFWVLVGAQMPAILFEMGYISNPEESARIADTRYQKWMVDGMIDGVKHYFANNL